MRAGEVEVFAALAKVLVRSIPEFHEVGGVVFTCSGRAMIAVHLVLQTSLVGEVEVEVADAALISRVDHERQLVRTDSGHVFRVGQTIGKPAAVLVFLKRRGDEFRQMIRVSEGPELCQVPLSAPHRIGIEHVILRHSMLHRHLADGAVVLGISTVHVAHHASAEQRMVEACIELLEVILVLAFHADASESFPPNHLRGVTCLVEAHASCLCLEIDAGILHRSVADAYLDGNLLTFFRVEVQIGSCSDAMRIGTVVVCLIAIKRADKYGFLIHDGREIDALVGIRLVLLDVFGSRYDVSLDGSVLIHPDFRVLHLAALALLMTDIEDEMRHLCLGIGKAEISHALGSRHFRIDVVLVEQHPIVTCSCIFVVVRKAGTIAARSRAVWVAGCCQQKACGGSNRDASHLKLVGADKTLDRSVAIVVAGSLPTVGITERAVG